MKFKLNYHEAVEVDGIMCGEFLSTVFDSFEKAVEKLKYYSAIPYYNKGYKLFVEPVMK